MTIEDIQKDGEDEAVGRHELTFQEKSPGQRVQETLEVLLKDEKSIDSTVELIKKKAELSAAYEDAKKIITDTTNHFAMEDGEAVVDKRDAIAVMVDEIFRGDDLVLKTHLQILTRAVKMASKETL